MWAVTWKTALLDLFYYLSSQMPYSQRCTKQGRPVKFILDVTGLHFTLVAVWIYLTWWSLTIDSVISVVKPTRCTDVSNYFILEWHSTYFGRSFRPSSGFQDCTVHTATVIWQTDTAVCLLAGTRSICLTYACCCMLSLELLMIKQSAVSVWHMPVAVCKVLNSWWSSSQQYLFDICLLQYVKSWTPDDQAVSSICLTYACCCM